MAGSLENYKANWQCLPRSLLSHDAANSLLKVEPGKMKCKVIIFFHKFEFCVP